MRRNCFYSAFYVVLGALLFSCGTGSTGRKLANDLAPRWDTVTMLVNPDKGWYHHYMDNSLTAYGLESEAELDSFPSMHHLFIRIPWAALEPEEGKFDWRAIDTSVARWAPKGYKFSLDITCKETMGEQMPYATPQWVEKAGAKGVMVNSWDSDNWEPDYNDPIFLEKLNNFHRAMAARYDGKEWLLDITTGSIGEWGEGHSQNNVRAEVVITHLDILLNNYPNTQVIIGDDYLRAGKTPEETLRLRQYVKEKGVSYRDDSVFWEDLYAFPGTIQNVDFFEDVWRESPVTLEMCHYRYYKDRYWNIPDGHGGGLDTIKQAIRIAHATFLSFHGTVREWHKDNPNAARELVNMLGYWIMPESFEAQKEEGKLTLSIAWYNKGVAPAYTPYKLLVRITDDNGAITTFAPAQADNDQWLPGVTTDSYDFDATGLASGTYQLQVMLYKAFRDGSKRPILLGMQPEYSPKLGWYDFGSISL